MKQRQHAENNIQENKYHLLLGFSSQANIITQEDLMGKYDHTACAQHRHSMNLSMYTCIAYLVYIHVAYTCTGYNAHSQLITYAMF